MINPTAVRTATGQSPYSVIIDQPAWWGPVGFQWTELVWTPFAPGSNAWHCDRVSRNPNCAAGLHPDGIDCRIIRGSYLFRCYEGEYIPPDSSHPAYTFVTNGVWPGGTSTGNYNPSGLSYATLYQNQTAKPMKVAIPAGTTKLYALFDQVPDSVAEFYLSITGGELLYNTVKVGEDCDEPDVPARAYEFEAWLLIAKNCGDQELTITPDGSNIGHVCGFICVTDKPSNPLDGVMDPGSRVDIMPRTQSAICPVQYKLGGGSAQIWGIGGHTDEYDTLLNGVETRQYLLDGVVYDWSPAARTHVRMAVDQYGVQLTGDQAVNVSDVATVANKYTHKYEWAGGNLRISNVYTATSEAVALGYKWAGTSYDGGYCAQRGLAERNWRRELYLLSVLRA